MSVSVARAAAVATILASTILAGCMGEPDGPLDALFTWTPLNADHTEFRFEGSSGASTYTWDFGDRTGPKTGRIVDHTFEHSDGIYAVTLTVTESTGATRHHEERVQVGLNPNTLPLLYLSADQRRVGPGQEVLFDATQSMDADQDPLYFQWDFNSKLEQGAFDDLENLGNQQYGRYPAGKPAPQSAAGGNETGGDAEDVDGRTPSGHVWSEELERAKAGLLRRAGIEGLDGVHGAPVEPRNADFDGRLEDDGPMQMFSFPAPATYFVHVRVVDIKGEGQEGFIRIRVEDPAPPATNSTRLKDTLEPAPLAALHDQSSPHGVESRIAYPMSYKSPGTSSLTLTYTATPSQAEQRVSILVCGTTAFSECRDGTPLAKLAAGESGRAMTWTVQPDQADYTYTLFVVNEGNAVVDYDFTVATSFDLNPWVLEEAGFPVGH